MSLRKVHAVLCLKHLHGINVKNEDHLEMLVWANALTIILTMMATASS